MIPIIEVLYLLVIIVIYLIAVVIFSKVLSAYGGPKNRAKEDVDESQKKSFVAATDVVSKEKVMNVEEEGRETDGSKGESMVPDEASKEEAKNVEDEGRENDGSYHSESMVTDEVTKKEVEIVEDEGREYDGSYDGESVVTDDTFEDGAMKVSEDESRETDSSEEEEEEVMEVTVQRIRYRGPKFSRHEVEKLKMLTQSKGPILECLRRDEESVERKKQAWDDIEKEFNKDARINRPLKSLKIKYNSLKCCAKVFCL
ncbi:uncharacterized protein LOC142229498 isoform X2 [Haematobia irritans]|uniref:uncharacterized protein LOC142229498 isoform X2 n=1 Tax=Haematobia irritans TaxID=7368 RepID=UPI003F4F477D